MMRIVSAMALFAVSQAVLAGEPATLGKEDCKIEHPSPKWRMTATWTGACKDGFADGHGTLEFFTARKLTMHYEGDVRRGAPNGAGYLRHANSMQYEGGFKDGYFHGQGTRLTWDGRYDGEFKDGEPDGRGKMKFTLGGSYEGEWKDGKFHGQGTAVYISGRVFTGDFIDGREAGTEPESRSKGRYRVPSREPGYGTRLHFNRATSEHLPFHKGYHQMTPAEQSWVRGAYPLLDKDDEPPYPINGSRNMYTQMSLAMSRFGDEGEMTLFVDVDSTGKATSASVYNTPTPELAKAAMVIVLMEKYKPALCAGKPCAMKFPISMQFNWTR